LSTTPKAWNNKDKKEKNKNKSWNRQEFAAVDKAIFPIFLLTLKFL